MVEAGEEIPAPSTLDALAGDCRAAMRDPLQRFPDVLRCPEIAVFLLR
jgi:hypothetical protein